MESSDDGWRDAVKPAAREDGATVEVQRLPDEARQRMSSDGDTTDRRTHRDDGKDESAIYNGATLSANDSATPRTRTSFGTAATDSASTTIAGQSCTSCSSIA